MVELHALEKGELTLQLQPFSIRAAVHAVLQSCAMARRDDGVSVEWLNERDELEVDLVEARTSCFHVWQHCTADTRVEARYRATWSAFRRLYRTWVRHFMPARMHARTHARTHARMHARARARTHARMHARTRARTHARTRARHCAILHSATELRVGHCAVTNAMKFCRGSPVHVTVTTEMEPVTQLEPVTPLPPRHVLRVDVKDWGIGLAPEDAERIFLAYEHAAPEAGGGTGIGLHVSRLFARAMGGDIAVQSKLGEGSTCVPGTPLDAPVHMACLTCRACSQVHADRPAATCVEPRRGCEPASSLSAQAEGCCQRATASASAGRHWRRHGPRGFA
jgi:hypothetical protein